MKPDPVLIETTMQAWIKCGLRILQARYRCLKSSHAGSEDSQPGAQEVTILLPQPGLGPSLEDLSDAEIIKNMEIPGASLSDETNWP